MTDAKSAKQTKRRSNGGQCPDRTSASRRQPDARSDPGIAWRETERNHRQETAVLVHTVLNRDGFLYVRPAWSPRTCCSSYCPHASIAGTIVRAQSVPGTP
eukprot:595374-Rhodomonas_salina.2